MRRETTDRRKGKEGAAVVPPPPLLLLPASQSLTFSNDESSHMMPGVLMPVPLQQPTGDSDGFTTCELDQSPQPASDGLSGLQLEQSFQPLYPPADSEMLKSSKSWNSFRMSGKPQYAVPAADYSSASVSVEPQMTHSSSGYFVPSAVSVPTAVQGSAPRSLSTSSLETSALAPPASALAKSPTDQPSPIASVGGQTKYIPVTYHWFFCRHRELRQLWEPFSFADSVNLEDAFRSGDSEKADCVVSTDGGRYDVSLASRARKAVYWDEPDSSVRRCSWFYRQDGDSRLVPYEEEFSEKLEGLYKSTLSAGDWHQKHELPGGDTVIFHSQTVIMHFSVPQTKSWTGAALSDPHPRVVKRGADDMDSIYEGESTQVDHLMFVVHGIGPTCDLRFRNIIECVDDFRMISHQMLSSHFKQHLEDELIGRVEFLPVRWHAALHGDATGIDRKLKAITLSSIGKLRQFTNDTLIDVLFYGSPAYAQKIADTVGNEMNRLYKLFLSRNPNFKGGVSVAGHSLGSLILFDLLVHQRCQDLSSSQDLSHSCMEETTGISTLVSGHTSSEPSGHQHTDEPHAEGAQAESELTVNKVLTDLNLSNFAELFAKEQIDIDSLMMIEDNDLKELGLPLGPRKKLFSFINDLRSKKTKTASLRVDLATASILELQKNDNEDFFPDFTDHGQSDPVLRSASSTSVNFVVGDAGTGIPFIRYPQLDFSPENFFALGSPVAMFLTVRGVASLGEDFQLPTCPGFFNIFHPFDPVAYRMEPMITSSFPVKPVLMPHHKGRKRLHLELRDSLSRVGSDLKQKVIESVKSTWRTINDFALAHRTSQTMAAQENIAEKEEEGTQSDAVKDFDDSISICSVMGDDDYPVGTLNQGKRLDYVLQEKPIESFNEYLFALSSHGCYWDSEDTVLLILKETYGLLGFMPQKPGLDLGSAQHTPATFPRHPLSQPIPRPGYAYPVESTELPSTQSLLPTTLASSEENSQNIGPPPMSGFVRK